MPLSSVAFFPILVMIIMIVYQNKRSATPVAARIKEETRTSIGWVAFKTACHHILKTEMVSKTSKFSKHWVLMVEVIARLQYLYFLLVILDTGRSVSVILIYSQIILNILPLRGALHLQISYLWNKVNLHLINMFYNATLLSSGFVQERRK